MKLDLPFLLSLCSLVLKCPLGWPGLALPASCGCSVCRTPQQQARAPASLCAPGSTSHRLLSEAELGLEGGSQTIIPGLRQASQVPGQAGLTGCHGGCWVVGSMGAGAQEGQRSRRGAESDQDSPMLVLWLEAQRLGWVGGRFALGPFYSLCPSPLHTFFVTLSNVKRKLQ